MNFSWGILSKYRNQIYGIAAIWIILFHGLRLGKCALSKNLKFLSGYIEHGNLGVEVFLFLSGIGLYFSLKNKSITEFYMTRLKRILLPLLLIDGIYWLYLYLIGKIDFIQVVKNLTFYSFWFEGYGMVWYGMLRLVQSYISCIH